MLGRYIGATLLILGGAMLVAPEAPESGTDARVGAGQARTDASQEQRADTATATVQSAASDVTVTSRAATAPAEIDPAAAQRASELLAARQGTDRPAGTQLAPAEAPSLATTAAGSGLAPAQVTPTDLSQAEADALTALAVSLDASEAEPVPSLDNLDSLAGDQITAGTLALIAAAEREAETTERTEEVAAATDEALSGNTTLFVTGSRVNVRSGPSTGFGVIGSVGYGEAVELVAYEGESWARIRIDGGETGFMARRFLARDLSDG